MEAQAAYTIVGNPTAQGLVDAVNRYLAAGWVAQGGPTQGAAMKGSALAMHTGRPVPMWFQAIVLPADVAARLAAEAAGAAGNGPGKQALSAAEIEELEVGESEGGDAA